MLDLRGIFRAVLVLAATTAATPSAWAADDIYVAMATGEDGGGADGSSSHPYKTITFALNLASSGDTIKVKGGTTGAAYYTVSNGETFPIMLKSGVSIDGDESSTSAWPRIGGDVGGSVSALFEIDATAASFTTMEVRNLRFRGEDVVSQDSPIALLATVANDNTVDLIFTDNICERPNMNASGSGGLATIQVEVNDGGISCAIADNTIYVSDRGGVEFLSVQEDDEQSETNISVTDNLFTNAAGDAGLFALRWHAPDVGGSNELGCLFGAIERNTINGRTQSLVNGIEIIAEEHTQAGQGLSVAENVIKGLAGDAITLKVDGWNDPLIPKIAGSIDRNEITGNGGSGIVLVWDETNHAEDMGYGYFAMGSKGNLIAGNGGYGYELRGLGINSASNGGLISQSNTIVYNELGGEGYFDLELGEDPDANFFAEPHTNDIMYFNNANGDQVDGLTSGQLDVLEAGVSYCDWKGIDESAGNIDQDPGFIAHGVFRHLDTGSHCIDVGFNGMADLLVDIDGEVRIQDGDCLGDPAAVVDMGCDEFPEPDCE